MKLTVQQVMEAIDEEIESGTIHPLTLVLDLLETHILEDGIKGQDKFQDVVGEAWALLCKAHEFSNLN